MDEKKTLKDDLKEIGGAAEEGIQAVRGAVFAVKTFFLGLMLVGVGVSQAAFGWIGNGFLYRVLYPIPLIGFGALILWSCFTPESIASPEQISSDEQKVQS